MDSYVAALRSTVDLVDQTLLNSLLVPGHTLPAGSNDLAHSVEGRQRPISVYRRPRLVISTSASARFIATFYAMSNNNFYRCVQDRLIKLKVIYMKTLDLTLRSLVDTM